jgi:hypothetical protein
MKLLEKYYPEKNIKITSKDPDYMTPTIKTKLIRKNKLMRRGRVEEANQLAMRIGHDIAKRNSTQLKHVDSRTASKDMWGAVRRLTNRDHAVQIPPGVDADVLNQHYAATSTDSSYTRPLRKSTAQGNEEPFTEWEVFSMLDSLKVTATGLDNLPAWFLRLGAPFFTKPITKLLNRSITESWVPIQWKRAYIRPIQKVRAPTGPADFRPISITPVLSRLVEKMVVKHYFYPAIDNPPPQLSFDDQFAFRPGGSTTAALISMLQAISELLLTNPYVVIITLDFSKAFDTVRHSTLTEKLAMLDMPDNVYNWLVSFLEGHSHQTKLADEESGFEDISASIIQGSSIGPGSFDVAASDLHPIIQGNRMFKFADDIDLVVPASHIDSRTSELNNIDKWASCNNLCLNRKKTFEMVFRKPRDRSNSTPPELAGLQRVSSLKILGVTLTENFSMTNHVSERISSSGQSLYALKILSSHGMDRDCIQTVFRATVMAKLTYASPAWWGFTNADTRLRLESFLRRSSRAGFYSAEQLRFHEICDGADDNLFHAISTNTCHPLHRLLPPKVVRHHDLRKRAHPFQLPKKENSLLEQNFIYRMLYKNVY